MKVIDLINDYNKGKELPKRIMFKGIEWYYDDEQYHRTDRTFSENLWSGYKFSILDQEVEIIEEDKKIEEIDVLQKILSKDKIEALTQEVQDIEKKLNEIIKVINEMREDK